MRTIKFIEDEIYHVYNRGVEKRKIFMDKRDYLRFIHSLFEFNDENPVLNLNYVIRGVKNKERKPRKLFVEILMFTLMPNHFHLLLKQKKENGVSRFMHKLGTGYTNYFNKRHERVGSLFQNKFKAVLIDEHPQFLYIPFYIHSNPLKLKNYGSRASIIEKMKFLENYRWSSLPDYIGKKNFPSVTQRDFLLDFCGGVEKYKRDFREWVREGPKIMEAELP